MKSSSGALFCVSLVVCAGLGGCDGTAPSPDKTAAAPEKGVLAEAASWGGGAAPAGRTDLLAENWYIVFDGSGSMGSRDCSSGRPGGRIVDAKDAIRAFVGRLPPSANVGLYVFDAKAWGERVPLGGGAINRQAVLAAVDDVDAGNGTPLGPSLMAGYTALKAQAGKQSGYGGYHLVVETDGIPEGIPDGEALMARAVDQIVRTPIDLETIGFCIAQDHPLNRPGRTLYRNAMNPADLAKGLDAILAESDGFSDDGGRGSAVPGSLR